jgi:hypothetical protein
MPEASTYFNAGVFGQSTTGSGVSGLSTSGAGVSGASTNNVGVAGINLASNPTASAPGVQGFAAVNRGGQFGSTKAAQVRLVPIASDGDPTIAGLAGDLLVTIDGEQVAHLWFCTKDGTENWQSIG